MKSYTDLEQSKKLAEILPLESADMWYHGHGSPWKSERIYDKEPSSHHSTYPQWDIPCWSLTALLNVLPPTIISDGIESCNIEMFKSLDGNTWYFQYFGEFDIILETKGAPIDACVEMIVKLNEVKML